MDFFGSSPTEGQDLINESSLLVDEAHFNLTSTLDTVVRVYSLTSDCRECPYTYMKSLNRSSYVLKMSTKFDTSWRFYDEKSISLFDTYMPADDETFLCQIDGDFGQFGIYDITVGENVCEYTVVKEPVNIYSPLLFVLFVLILSCVGAWLFRKFRWKETVHDDEELALSVGAKSSRTRSIDTFRGLALVLMMFVNEGGAEYWFFNHTTWGGCYPADLLYPWFLWIVGLCIPLSLKSSSSHSVCTLTKKILQRTAVMFLFGLTFNSIDSGPVDIFRIRAMGILQRIALCYGVVSLINVFVWRSQVRTFSSFNNSTRFLRLWLIHLGILGIHFYFTYYFPVPGCPRGYLGPGGIHKDGLYFNCTGGATGYIDRLLLGNSHITNLYHLHKVYRTIVPFDPENILGTLTAIFQTFLGTQAGYILCMRTSTPLGKIRLLLMCGGVTLALGLILHYGDLIPINKKLWTLSFVLTTSGLAFMIFAALYFFIDYARLWSGVPFFYPGTNSVLVFMGHRICQSLLPWHWRTGSMDSSHFIQLVENIWGVILWVLITRKLFQKRLLFNV